MKRERYALLVLRSCLWGPGIAMLLLAVILSAGCSKKKTAVTVLPEPEPQKNEQPAPEPEPDFADAEPEPEQVERTAGPLATVYFEFDNARLAPQEAMKLDHLLGGSGELELRGHACTWGTNDYNMGLSVERANTVAAYLGRGLVLGFGEEMCGAACETVYESDCEACRKVEVWAK